MRRPLLLLAAASAAALLVPATRATPDDLRSITGMQGHERVLLTFAPRLDDPRLAEQRRILARFAVGAAERDLVFVQVADGKVFGATDKADKLRKRFSTPPGRYRTLLLGKDGHTALDLAGPVGERQLAEAIDAMPMRRQEVRRIHAGLGKSAG